jgi:hypothetical protein
MARAGVPSIFVRYVYAAKLSWLGGGDLVGLSVEDQIQFASVGISTQYWNFINSGEGMNAGQMDYRYDLLEYPNKVKKFFLPGSSRRKIPTQNLNIQTSTFKTNPRIFTERYGPIHGFEAFQEF